MMSSSTPHVNYRNSLITDAMMEQRLLEDARASTTQSSSNWTTLYDYSMMLRWMSSLSREECETMPTDNIYFGNPPVTTQQAVCADCGGTRRYVNLIEIEDGTHICGICWDRRYGICPLCGLQYDRDDGYEDRMVRYGHNLGVYAHPDCAERGLREGSVERCASCDLIVHPSDTIHVSFTDQLLCHDCFRQNYYICYSCGHQGIIADGYTTDQYGELVHPDCHVEQVIQGYHSSVKDNRKYGDDCDKYFGIELEVSREGAERNKTRKYLHECARHIRDNIFGDSIAMFYERDSSIERGFEIISPPMTKMFYDDTASPLFEKMLSYLNEAEFWSETPLGTDGSCGLHIHVGLPWFGVIQSEQEYTITKTLLAYERFFDDILKLSRRKDERYMSYADKYNTKNMRELDRLTKRPKYENSKYRAVNLCNEMTVEFRIFNGTLDITELEGAIEFTLALVESARVQDIYAINNAASLRDILAPSMTESLSAYLGRHGL